MNTKNIFYVSLMLGLCNPLCCKGGDTLNYANAKDYKVVYDAMEKAGDIIADGELGDFIVKLRKNTKLTSVYNKAKNSTFLSISKPEQYIEDGYCLVNVVPLKTKWKIGIDKNHEKFSCDYRLFCGGFDDMNDGLYSVEVCER